MQIWSPHRSSENSNIKCISWLTYVAFTKVKAARLHYHTTVTILYYVWFINMSLQFLVGWTAGLRELPSVQNTVYSYVLCDRQHTFANIIHIIRFLVNYCAK